LAELQSSNDTDFGLTSGNDNPFSTIESAQEFVKLLTKAVDEAKGELEAQVDKEPGSDPSRRLDALRIAIYSLGKLKAHMHHSGRILNDLRTLRRLLLAERSNNSKTASAS
jgi:hypothetical protein